MNKREVGSRKEDTAARYLEQIGMRILCRNYSCYRGEIDLIARDGDYLVFVEVKYRYNDRYGWGEAHVTRVKQQKIVKVAKQYLLAQGYIKEPLCRFDVIAIDGERLLHFPNAFEAGD